MRFRVLLLLLGILCVSPGCGPGNRNQKPPAASDPVKAKQVLTEVLDAWKSGATAESLREKTPAVMVKDASWRAGDKLQSYQIQGNGTQTGTNVTFNVTLEVRSAAGSAQRTPADYIVTTEPTLIVRRSDAEPESPSAGPAGGGAKGTPTRSAED